MKKFYLSLLLLLISTLSYSQNSCPGIATVDYGGQTYNTVLIGNQCWLKENLNIGTQITGTQIQINNSIIEKYCYGDDPLNCNTFGGLYQWDEAMQYISTAKTQGICPTGWHIPTNAEILTLGNSVGGNSNSLKAIGQGVDTSAGTNTSGFSGLLTGLRIPFSGSFSGLSIDGYYWSSTQSDATHADLLDLSGNDRNVNQYAIGKDGGLSIRCLQDASLLLQSPNGGESLQGGSTQNITWTAGDVVNAKIEFTSDNGTTWSTIIASTSVTPGLFSWAVPNITSTNCRIKLSDVTDTSVTITSSNVFTVFVPLITITSPVGGENWKRGSLNPITWTSSFLPNTRIELTTDNGISWTTIIDSVSTASGFYSWLVTNTVSDQCKVRLSNIRDTSFKSISANVFTISNPACPGLETIVYGGQTYNTILVGKQCWLKENLNIGARINGLQQQTNNSVVEKYCYNNDPANCTTYGGLYQWAEAVQYLNGATNALSPNPPFPELVQGICPTGFHIPDTTDFRTLFNMVNNNGNSLKSTGIGSGNGIGTNLSGFTGLFAGVRFSDGSFSLLGLQDFALSSTDGDAMNNYNTDIGFDYSEIFMLNNAKNYGRSVRCVNDTLFQDSTLPVELTSFTALSLNNAVSIKWKTATEINSASFDIERRVNNDTWLRIASVKASGNSTTPKYYSYTDNKVNSGTFSYRLKMVDYNGTYKYSSVVMSEVAAPSNYELANAYPNPWNPTTTIGYRLPMDIHVTIRVYNTLGKEVATLVNEVKPAGSYEVTLNGKGLSSGVYYYQMKAGNFIGTKKIVLMK
jgi:uncharacterized protein (TIGR02145 family)